MSDFAAFAEQRRKSIAELSARAELKERFLDLLKEASDIGYMYNFDWLGLPIIQLPQDIVAIQELIWKIRPGAIVETGIARGGSLVLSASILELIGEEGIVVGVDIDIREHNRKAIEQHKLAHRIRLVQGSSIDPAIVSQVTELVRGRGPVMVFLDSNHTHEHALAELNLYSPLVGLGSYVVMFDTVIEYMPPDQYPDRPWGRGNNPLTAIRSFLGTNDRFEIDRDIDAKLLFSCNPNGYLRCIRDKN
jgi:cephalosporin hydroxylase